MTLPGAPIRADDPVRFADPLPDACDVVIIGGGIAGVATALFLARQGVQVLICEKGRIAAEQSSRNWGWVRQQGRDPAELPIMIESLRHWQAFQDRLGDQVGLRRTGVTYLAKDGASLARYEDWLQHARAHGLDSRMVSQAELQAILPNSAEWIGGLTTPSDARAEPWTAVPALASLAHEMGVKIVENCAVRVLDIQNGEVSGVMTEAGPVRASRVLLAGGAWSGLFARNAGLRIPQLSVRGTVAATVPLPAFREGAIVDSGFALRRRLDKGYTLAPGVGHDFWIGPDALRYFRTYLPQLRREQAHTRIRPVGPWHYPDGWLTRRRWRAGDVTPFERVRVLDPPPSQARLKRLQQDFEAAFPQIGHPHLRRAWAGMIDVMPDEVPVLDETPLRGFFVATGLSGHGFGIGPGVGRVMADLIRGQPPGHDLTRFRFGRFTDGTALELGPSL